MNYYVLILLFTAPLGVVATTAGPFTNIFACELAASQAMTLNTRSRSVCVQLNANPHHWNGKRLK